MSKIVARPINAKEPDLLIGNEKKLLTIQDLAGDVLARISPDSSGWTHVNCWRLISIAWHPRAGMRTWVTNG